MIDIKYPHLIKALTLAFFVGYLFYFLTKTNGTVVGIILGVIMYFADGDREKRRIKENEKKLFIAKRANKINKVIEEYKSDENIKKGYKGLEGLIKAGVLDLENNEINEVLKKLENRGIENIGGIHPLQMVKDKIQKDYIKDFLVRFNNLPFGKRNEHEFYRIIEELNKS